MQRSRDWRRHHTGRVIQHRRRIILDVWAAGSRSSPDDGYTPENFVYLRQPHRMHKHNFTCACGMCRLGRERYDNAIARRDERRLIEAG